MSSHFKGAWDDLDQDQRSLGSQSIKGMDENTLCKD